MTTTTFSTVIGVFADNDQANRAIDELRRAKFSYGRIRLVERGTGTFRDTLRGMFTGQASTVSNTADDLIKMGMPEQDARYYQSELDTGGVMVIMNADDRPEQAFGIMRQGGAFDINGHLKMDPPNVPVGAYNSDASRAANNPNTVPGTPNPDVPPSTNNPAMPPSPPPQNVPPAYNPNGLAETSNPNGLSETDNPSMPSETPTRS